MTKKSKVDFLISKLPSPLANWIRKKLQGNKEKEASRRLKELIRGSLLDPSTIFSKSTLVKTNRRVVSDDNLRKSGALKDGEYLNIEPPITRVSEGR